MNNLFELISVQPLLKTQDSLVQWSYYESLITNHLDTLESNCELTFICLPEYALGNKTTYSEDTFLKLNDRISLFAKEQKCTIIAGSYAHFENNKWYNRSLIFNTKGHIGFYYDKTHPFNFELLNGITAGSNKEVFLIEGLKVKLLICSDLWFPEEIRDLLNEEIDVIIVPAMAVVKNNQLVNYGKSLWHSLALTRSKENVIPVMVSDWAVQPMRNSYTCGSSCIINPSIRWNNEFEEKKAFNTVANGNEGIISSIISQKEILEYQKYRKEVGLLPDFK